MIDSVVGIRLTTFILGVASIYCL